nr:MAG: hypothetical protein DIU78_14505 [Pseudomonadota bacterium]
MQLVDADEPNSHALSLAAPPGAYQKLSIGIGLPAACNAGDPTLRVFPLNADGGMYWTWGTRYVFLRMEGTRWVEPDWVKLGYHIGFDESYRAVELEAELVLGGGAEAPTLVVDVARLSTSPDGESMIHGLMPDWIIERLSDEFFLRPVP